MEGFTESQGEKTFFCMFQDYHGINIFIFVSWKGFGKKNTRDCRKNL